jgi:hypothetical protein
VAGNAEGEAKGAPPYQEGHVSDGETKNVSPSIWHGLAAWTLLAEILIIGGMLLILAVRGCA